MYISNSYICECDFTRTHTKIHMQKNNVCAYITCPSDFQ